MIGQFQGRAVDSQELEVLLRLAVFRQAKQIARHLFQERADAIDAAYQAKPGWHYKGRQTLQVESIFGSFKLERDYYYSPKERRGHCPADAALALEGSCTPALARLVSLESIDEPSFEKAEKHLKETGGIDFPARQLQRFAQEIGPAAQAWQEREVSAEACDAPVMYVSGDGTGVPMRREELAGRKGKQEDGSCKTRQAYLGCVFTQHTRDEKGRPIRDYNSTSYIATFGGVEDLGLLLRREARRRGSGTAKEIVVLIDGALGLERQGKINFPGCLQIVDFYHALQHLKTLAEALLGPAHPASKAQCTKWTKLLLKDGAPKIVEQARLQSAGQPNQDAVSKALNYFEHNLERMRYGTFREKGYFIGSGVVEAGCKTVIGARCKQSGMFWSQTGAENILGLRCIERSGQWTNFWRQRANDHTARNDSLALAA